MRHGRTPPVRTFFVLLGAIVFASCGGQDTAPPGGGRSPSNGGSPLGERLAWSQPAPTLAAAQAYRVVLYIDGMPSDLSAVTCVVGTGPGYDCTAPMPQLSGRHVIELAAIDPGSGLESPRSEGLVVGESRATSIWRMFGASVRQVPGAPVASAPASTPPEVPSTAPAGTSVTCTTETPVRCFTAALLADDIGAVLHLATLPDSRLLLLLDDNAIRILPSGELQSLDVGRREPGTRLDVADVAVDPDFDVNRFLYFAVISSRPGLRRTMRVVRFRELADRLGEAATIVPDFPVASAGNPALSIGPDRQLYVATPAASGPLDVDTAYDGLVLRFTRDGAAAGNAGAGSPILAFGSVAPTSLVWADSRLVMSSNGSSGEPTLVVVPVTFVPGAWPARATRIGGGGADTLRAVSRVVAIAAPGAHTSKGETMLSFLGADPQALYLATLASGERPDVTSLQPLSFGSLTPIALASANGDVIVAARLGDAGAPVRLIRLRQTAAGAAAATSAR